MEHEPLLVQQRNEHKGNGFYLPRQNGDIKTQTYYRRFWILFVTAFLNWFHCVEWNTWGPISESVEAAFPSWDSGTVAMMANWGTIMFVIFVGPFCWIAHKLGLRVGVLVSTAVFVLGLCLRCITSDAKTFTVFCHICSAMIGAAATLMLATPPMIASHWFPPHERTTAVGLIMSASQMGHIGSYLEPLLVRVPGDGATADDIKHDIMRLMYIGAGIGVATLVAVILYFPSKPPVPPSLTSSVKRLPFVAAVKSMLKNKHFLLVIVTYGVAVGPTLAWITVLNYSLLPVGLHQDEGMWVGLTAVIACGVTSVIAGRFTDLIYGHIKVSVIVLLLASSFCFFWFLLLSWGYIFVTKWQIFVSVSGGIAINYAVIPLFYELAIELAYPVPEVLAGGAVTASDNLFSSLFLLIYLIPDVGYLWVTYALLGTNALTVLPLLFVKESYSRSSIDRDSL